MPKYKPRAKAKPAWLSMLPAGLEPSKLTLEELRTFKWAHTLVTEPIPGPEGIAYCIRCFRYLLFFGSACISEKTYPPLNRCCDELEKLFMNDPMFGDGTFVQSWILMDFPFGPQGQTALDYFEEFLKKTEVGREFQPFIDEARKSRLGLYEDLGRTKKAAKFRELFTGRVISIYPSVVEYDKGEILLGRAMAFGDQVFMFGDPPGFPSDMKTHLETTVWGRSCCFDAPTPIAQYEIFMKFAGPYWMSCVTTNNDVAILDGDHYLTYLGDR